jgi:dTDP-4-amino-4,6-dideoxygalactose transaminase
MDAADAERAVTPRTRALMPVQLNGRTCDMDAIGAVAARHGLTIVEDAAQALGSRFRGRYAGTFGAAAAISFYPAKILGCLGDGGAVIARDDAVARTVRLLRDHGRDEHGDVQLWGFNSRLDNLQAAVLDHQFRRYAATVARRRAVAALYQQLLGDVPQLVLPPAPDDGPHFDVFQNYEIESERRDELKAHLARAGVGTLLPWGGKAVHQFAALGLTRPLPWTDRLFTRVLMLPMNTMISDEDVAYIAGCIREFHGC